LPIKFNGNSDGKYQGWIVVQTIAESMQKKSKKPVSISHAIRKEKTMNNSVKLAVLLSTVLYFSGCAYYSKMAVPVSPCDKDNLEVIAHVNKASQGVRLFMIGGVPSAMELVKKTIDEMNGDGIVNLEVTFSEGFLGLITFPTVTIEGDIVRLRSHEINSASLTSPMQPESSTGEASRVDPVQRAIRPNQDESAELQDWRVKVLNTYKSRWVSKAFADYIKKTDQNIEFSAWVKKLTSADFLEYQNSSFGLRDWVVEKLKKESKNKLSL